jgi:hypothetical protein
MARRRASFSQAEPSHRVLASNATVVVAPCTCAPCIRLGVGTSFTAEASRNGGRASLLARVMRRSSTLSSDYAAGAGRGDFARARGSWFRGHRLRRPSTSAHACAGLGYPSCSPFSEGQRAGIGDERLQGAPGTTRAGWPSTKSAQRTLGALRSRLLREAS